MSKFPISFLLAFITHDHFKSMQFNLSWSKIIFVKLFLGFIAFIIWWSVVRFNRFYVRLCYQDSDSITPLIFKYVNSKYLSVAICKP